MRNGYTKIENGWIVRYNKNNKIHCDDGPAMENPKDGTKIWFIDGKYHRENGPAIESGDGPKQWYIHGMRHCKDGPAYIGKFETKWYQYDLLHREDGPAIEYANGMKGYYIHGLEIDTHKIDDIILCLNNLRTHINLKFGG